MASKLGTVFVELSLDDKTYRQKLSETLTSSQTTARGIETSWKALGSKSEAIFDAQRKAAENAYTLIKNYSSSTANDIIRAEEAKNAKLKSLNDQQFGHHTSLIDNLKKNWIAASAAIVAAWMMVNKAMAYMDEAGKALQVESSFKIMADSAKVNSEHLIASMKKATKETIEDSDLMAKAVKLMLLEYNPEQIVRFSNVASTAAIFGATTVADAFDRLGDAIANRTPKALVRLGAVTKEQLKIVEEAVTAGANSMVLFELAISNLELKQKELQGTQDQATISLQRFHAEMKEFKETIGKGLIVVADAAYRMLEYLAAGVLGLVSAYRQYRTLVYEIMGDEEKAAVNREVANAAWAARNELIKKAGEAIFLESEVEQKASTQEIDNLKERIKNLMAQLAAYKGTAEAAKKAAQEKEQAEKSILEAIRKANYEIEGVGKSQYDKDIARIESEAEKYRKAGIDKVTVARYVAFETVLATERAFEVARIDAKKLAESWADTSRTLQAKIEMGGLDELRKNFIDNQLEADNLKDKYKALPPALKEIAYAEIDAAHKAADLTIINNAKNKSYKDYIDTSTKVADAYQSLQEKMNPSLTLTREYAEGVKLLAIVFAGLPQELKAATEALAKFIAITTAKTNIDKLAEEASYYKDLIGFEQTYRDKVLGLIEAQRVAEIKAAEDTKDVIAAIAAANAKAQQAKNDLAEKMYDQESNRIEKQWRGYSDMFEGISQLYAENTKGRKIMHDAAMAFEIAEKAVMIERAIVAAVEAVTTQGGGDPYTAFGRIAAMIALMAGVLARAGIGFGGGGGGGASTAVLPPSTVLGAAAGTGSESISKIWELLEDTYTMEYHELHGIYESMKELNQNITGLVSNIVRNYGTFAPGSSGINVGTEISSLVKIFSSLDFITGWAGKAWNWIFGGNVKTTITGMGIEIGTTILSDLLAGIDISVRTYADIKKVKSGWFGSKKTSYYTLYESVDEDTTRLFTSIFRDLGKTLLELAKGLGTDIQAVLDYIFPTVEINLKDLDAEAINKTLSEFFSATGDVAAKALFGMYQSYQKVGEGFLETAMRLVIDKEIVLDTLKMTGQAFVGTIPEIIAFSEAIIAMAGDLETLREAAETYYDKFFADAEKQARLQGQLTDIFADINKTILNTEVLQMVLPDTRAGYRQMLEGLDLTTKAGQEAYVMLLKLAEGADAYYTYLEEIASRRSNMDIQLLELQGKSVEALAAKRALELAAMDESLRPLLLLIYAQQDLNIVNEEAAELARARQTLEIQIMELTGDAAGALAARRALELAAMDESLRPLQERIWALQDEAAAAEVAADAWRATADAAKAAAEAAKEAADAVRERMVNAARENLEAAQTALRAAFDAEKTRLTEIYNTQLDAMNKSLDATKTIISDLQSSIDKLRSAKERMRLEDAQYERNQYRSAQADLARILAQARAGNLSSVKNIDRTLDILTGSPTDLYSSFVDYQRDYWKTYLSISELESLTGDQLTKEEVMASLLQKQIDTAKLLHESELAALDAQMNALLNINIGVLSIVDAIEQLRIATIALGTAGTVPLTRGMYAEGGSFRGGWRVVGERGPELEYTGPSSIFSYDKSKSLVNNSEVVLELKSLRTDLQRANFVIAKNMNKLVKINDRWDSDGLPDTRILT